MEKFIRQITPMLNNHGIYLSSEDNDFTNEDDLINLLRTEIGIYTFQFNGPSVVISTNPEIRLCSNHKIDIMLQADIHVPKIKRRLICAALYNVPYYEVSVKSLNENEYAINVESMLYGMGTTVLYHETDKISQEWLVEILTNNIGFSEKYWNYYINMRNIFPILTNK